jgi:hypothetical protein
MILAEGLRPQPMEQMKEKAGAGNMASSTSCVYEQAVSFVGTGEVTSRGGIALLH